MIAQRLSPRSDKALDQTTTYDMHDILLFSGRVAQLDRASPF
jgi:hypothetical protein